MARRKKTPAGGLIPGKANTVGKPFQDQRRLIPVKADLRTAKKIFAEPAKAEEVLGSGRKASPIKDR